jgi:hypothetical protein
MPALPASSASARAENGVSDAGLTTTVQPAAIAAAALRVIIADGKFHGVMQATTPTGSRRTVIRRPGRWLIGVSPSIRLASSANHSTKLAP